MARDKDPFGAEADTGGGRRGGSGVIVAGVGLSLAAGALAFFLSSDEDERNAVAETAQSTVDVFQSGARETFGGLSGYIFNEEPEVTPPEAKPPEAVAQASPAPDQEAQRVGGPVAPSPAPAPDLTALERELAALRRSMETLAATPRETSTAPADTSGLEAAAAELTAKLAEIERAISDEADANASRLRMIDARLKGLEVGGPTGPSAAELEAARAEAELEAERLRLEAAQRAERQQQIEDARRSGGVVFDEGDKRRIGGGADAGELAPRGGELGFLDQETARGFETATAAYLEYPDRTITQGTFITAVLDTAINTDLPGAVRATVMNDVRAFDGRAIILPRGTTLIGSYSSDVALFQERAFVAWNRAITPSGASIQLASIGTDPLGRSGVTGHVDTHFLERFGSAALISILGIAPSIAVSESGADNESAEAVQGVGDDFRNSVSDVVAEYLSIPPTINVGQGDVVQVFAGRDLVIFEGG